MRVLAAVFLLCVDLGEVQAGTLEDVRSNGILQCGVDQAVDAFSARQIDGTWTGLPVEYCRALALATLDDKSKVIFTLLDAQDRVEALQSGEVDVLVSALPIAVDYESRDGLLFTGPLFYDASAKENYGAAVRQGDDQWFVVTRWLQTVLTLSPKAAAKSCVSYDALASLKKNWACSVHAEYGGSGWLRQPD
jgi:Bacterial extracellular solute-binding proteins, family 3